MPSNLSNPIFHDEAAARAWFEARIWPNGPFCPHCGEAENLTRLHGKGGAKGTKGRPGLIQCNSCREQFTVTVNTVCERSKIPLTKWCMAIYLINASKKGMSALQMHRMMGGSYKTAWFMMHRIREAMRDGKLGPLGGEGKFVPRVRQFLDIGRLRGRLGFHALRVSQRGRIRTRPRASLS